MLVFGGSLGARSINLAAIDGLAGAPYRVLHVAGKRDFAELAAPDGRYLLRDYLSPFGAAARRRRPRGRPLRRLGVRARPVRPAGGARPYPHASADHQSTNARWMADAGAAVVVRDAELTPERLRAEVDAIALDPGRLAAMSAASAALARPDAARDIAAEVLAAARS